MLGRRKAGDRGVLGNTSQGDGRPRTKQMAPYRSPTTLSFALGALTSRCKAFVEPSKNPWPQLE